MTKLFVGGLSYGIDDAKLKDLFTQFGEVASAVIIKDKYTGQSKGFGFVEMSDDSAAQAAIKELDGSDLDGRRVGVSVARPREDSNSGFNAKRGGFANNDRPNRNFSNSRGGRRY